MKLNILTLLLLLFVLAKIVTGIDISDPLTQAITNIIFINISTMFLIMIFVYYYINREFDSFVDLQFHQPGYFTNERK